MFLSLLIFPSSRRHPFLVAHHMSLQRSFFPLIILSSAGIKVSSFLLLPFVLVVLCILFLKSIFHFQFCDSPSILKAIFIIFQHYFYEFGFIVISKYNFGQRVHSIELDFYLGLFLVCLLKVKLRHKIIVPLRTRERMLGSKNTPLRVPKPNYVGPVHNPFDCYVDQNVSIDYAMVELDEKIMCTL